MGPMDGARVQPSGDARQMDLVVTPQFDADRTLDVVDRELRALRILIDTRFDAVENASGILAQSTALRFEQTNEWRAQNDRERREFAKILALEAVSSRLRVVEEWRDSVIGALNMLRLLSAAGVIGLIITLLRMVRFLP